MEKTNELKIKIKNKDKAGVTNDFKILASAIEGEVLNMDQYFRAHKLLIDLREYIMEEAE